MIEQKRDDEPDTPEDSAGIQRESNQPQQPVKVGRFDVVRLIARGSCATIYEVATPGPHSQRLALKLMETDNEDILNWCRRAITFLAGLEHPNILPCQESGVDNGRLYLVMPLVEGGSVTEMALHRQRLPEVDEVLRIIRTVAAALDYIHGRQVVHGNLHPKNILLDRNGHVWLTGFGETGPGYPAEMCFGNPHHLAPEQLFNAFGQTVPQTDVYALAEVAFLLLSGFFPFEGLGAIAELFERKRSGFAPRIGKLRPELPPDVYLTLQRAMAVRPEDRPLSAGQFVAELDSAFAGSAFAG